MIGSKGSCHCWVLFHHKAPWNDLVYFKGEGSQKHEDMLEHYFKLLIDLINFSC